jgi:hypothetical protein
MTSLLLLTLTACSNGSGGSHDPDNTDSMMEDRAIPEDLGVDIANPDATIPPDVILEDGTVTEIDAITPADAEEELPDGFEPPDLFDLSDWDGDGEVDVDTEADTEPDLPGDLEQDVSPPQPCELAYDCEPGENCTMGFCEPFVPECDDETVCPDEETCVGGICLVDGMSPLVGKIIFNEVLADGNTDGDPNQDGTSDPVEDEFVELVNVSNEELDLSGWVLVENDWEEWLPRYTFPDGTTLAPKGAVVLFGGGDAPDSTDAVLYAASNAEDPGIPYGLDLDDSGDLIRLLDADLLLVAAFAYGDAGGQPAVSDESLTRDPDLTGTFVPHTFADGADGAIFSPGTRIDGADF